MNGDAGRMGEKNTMSPRVRRASVYRRARAKSGGRTRKLSISWLPAKCERTRVRRSCVGLTSDMRSGTKAFTTWIKNISSTNPPGT